MDKSAMETYRKSGYMQPKDKWDEEMKRFDYWDMIAFAEMHHERLVKFSLGDVSLDEQREATVCDVLWCNKDAEKEFKDRKLCGFHYLKSKME